MKTKSEVKSLKDNSILNITGIFISVLTLVLVYFYGVFDAFLPQSLSLDNYVSIISISIILLVSPDFLNSLFGISNSWYKQPAFYNIILFSFVFGLGYLPDTLLIVIQVVFWMMALGLLVWQIFQFVQGPQKMLTIFVGSISAVIIVIEFYDTDYHTVMIFEKVILGVVNLDIVFHSSLSGIFAQSLNPSTGLHGEVFYKYHWGSHVIIGGLKNVVGTSSIVFYNVGYLAIIIPFSIKSFILVINQFIERRLNLEFSIIWTSIFGLVFFFLTEINGQPFRSESFTISLVLCFLFLSVILNLRYLDVHKDIAFHVFTTLTILTISFVKISTGFVFGGVVAFMALKADLTAKNFVKLLLISCLIGVIVYIVIFPDARTTIQIDLLTRLQNISFGTSDLKILTPPILAILSFVMVRDRLFHGNKKGLFVPMKGFEDWEFLLIAMLLAFIGSIASSSNGSDVYYFMSVPLNFSLILLSLPLAIFFLKVKDTHLSTIPGITILVFSSFLIFKNSVDIVRDRWAILEGMRNMTQDQRLLSNLLLELESIGSNSKRLAVYIPESEDWYYRSQRDYPEASSFVVPAFAGKPMIGGIPEYIVRSRYPYYSYHYYYDLDDLAIKDLKMAKRIAVSKGYNQLVEIKASNDKLEVNHHILN